MIIKGDTVVRKKYKGVLVTLVDRTTREGNIKALSNRKVQRVAKTCIDLLKNKPALSKVLPSAMVKSLLDIG